MASALIRKYCSLDEQFLGLLKQDMQRLNLSAWAYDRILKVARIITDLDSQEAILAHHIGDAIQ